MGTSEISLLLLLVIIFVYYFCINNLCYLAEQRAGATKFAVVVYSIFFTPICGILYLLLFPRK